LSETSPKTWFNRNFSQSIIASFQKAFLWITCANLFKKYGDNNGKRTQRAKFDPSLMNPRCGNEAENKEPHQYQISNLVSLPKSLSLANPNSNKREIHSYHHLWKHLAESQRATTMSATDSHPCKLSVTLSKHSQVKAKRATDETQHNTHPISKRTPCSLGTTRSCR